MVAEAVAKKNSIFNHSLTWNDGIHLSFPGKTNVLLPVTATRPEPDGNSPDKTFNFDGIGEVLEDKGGCPRVSRMAEGDSGKSIKIVSYLKNIFNVNYRTGW